MESWYAYVIDEKRQLNVLMYKTDDEEEMGEVVRRIPHCDLVAIDRYVRFESFEDVSGMMEFIANRNGYDNFYFNVWAYDIVPGSKIRLFYIMGPYN